MQMPRRTSEFQNDSACIRRSSRNNAGVSPSVANPMTAACSGVTALKYNTRQSRIAVPMRSSSSERVSTNNPYLSVPNSTVKRSATPQRTPLPKPSANRVLFTAEKQRPTQAVPLHNDKKWVHEATQRITEYLHKRGTLSGGMSTDFLSRGLRQMSIKQFVAIINDLLSYIWGNRFTVGTNHVDDIINILQRLKYPYPINKSWLKTPNTQHSFGNVVVLLDYLLEFVPHVEEYPSPEEMYFNLKSPEDLPASDINGEPFQVPDLEFQRQLLSNSEKGFLLWDKQKIEEFNRLKEKTCNILLQKTCNVNNLEEMEIEIHKCKEILKSLESERPPEDREMLKVKSQLSRDLKNLNHEIKLLQSECESNKINLKDFASHKLIITEDLNALEKEVKLLLDTLNKQTCTVEKRDEMVENVMQYKQMLAIKDRAIQDLQNRFHNEQILKSKALKHLNDQIEKFNAIMREIEFSVLMKFDNNTSLSEGNLRLSLRPQQSDLEKLQTKLERINQHAIKNISDNKNKIFQLQEHCNQIKLELNARLFPELNDLKVANANLATDLQKQLHSFKMIESELLQIIKKLDGDLVIVEAAIEELQNLVKRKKSLVTELKEANEQTMKSAEEKHQQHLEQRRAFLKAYDDILEECLQSEELKQLTKQIEVQENQLEELRKDFKN